jgi:hypothetical protein
MEQTCRQKGRGFSRMVQYLPRISCFTYISFAWINRDGHERCPSSVTGRLCYLIEAWNCPHVQVVSDEATCFELASALTTCTWGQFQHKIPEQRRCELITSARGETSAPCSSIVYYMVFGLGVTGILVEAWGRCRKTKKVHYFEFWRKLNLQGLRGLCNMKSNIPLVSIFKLYLQKRIMLQETGLLSMTALQWVCDPCSFLKQKASLGHEYNLQRLSF